jgi:predicted RNA binding protein YcfA (HicA-like mRNA interferase family)
MRKSARSRWSNRVQVIDAGDARQVRALAKAGFQIIRQGKHIVMSDGTHQVTIPRHNPLKPFTMGGIVKDAGLTVEEFRKLL